MHKGTGVAQTGNKHHAVLAALENLMVADALCASATFQYDTAKAGPPPYFGTKLLLSNSRTKYTVELFAGRANASLHLAQRRKRPPPVQRCW